MNCASARNRLLAQADSAVVPDVVAGHLATCTACTAWHTLLTQLDVVVAATSVPVAGGGLKNQLLGQFQPPPAAPKPPAPASKSATKMLKPVVVANKPPVGDRLARLWPAGAIAAAVLVGVLVWVNLKDDTTPVVEGPPRDPMLAKVVQAKVDFDKADNNAKRLEVLDRLAGNIHEQATTLSMVTPGTDMELLATMYEKVVMESLVVVARSLSEEERKEMLQRFVVNLSEAEDRANLSASNAPPGSAEPLRFIARTAGEGRIQLARMQKGRA